MLIERVIASKKINKKNILYVKKRKTKKLNYKPKISLETQVGSIKRLISLLKFKHNARKNKIYNYVLKEVIN